MERMRVCHHCNESFRISPTGRPPKYCSATCRKKAWEKERLEAALEQARAEGRAAGVAQGVAAERRRAALKPQGEIRGNETEFRGNETPFRGNETPAQPQLPAPSPAPAEAPPPPKKRRKITGMVGAIGMMPFLPSEEDDADGE
ncbi:hypothetical protein [Streptomyces sp. BH104]|uniref:hypothetical protein n=1 Tax=unclassified Streptomyces TaxID=2593676 RepID=UPI003BB4892B